MAGSLGAFDGPIHADSIVINREKFFDSFKNSEEFFFQLEEAVYSQGTFSVALENTNSSVPIKNIILEIKTNFGEDLITDINAKVYFDNTQDLSSVDPVLKDSTPAQLNYIDEGDSELYAGREKLALALTCLGVNPQALHPELAPPAKPAKVAPQTPQVF